MSRPPPDRAVGPWAKDKLESLAAYLDFYTKVLKNQSWLEATWYVDAFAGAGRSRIRREQVSDVAAPLFEEEIELEQIEFLKGSPRVALDVANPFTNYLFIEKSPTLVKELRALQLQYPLRSMEIVTGDANDQLRQFLSRHVGRRGHRGVVFLDPFAMQVPWTTIALIAEAGWLEVILNFPLHMAVDRLFVKSGEIPPGWRDRLDVTLGSSAWRELVYETTTDLLGPKVIKRERAAERVLDWLRDRLRRAFGYVSPAQLISSTRGNPLYYLIWAGPHRRGVEGASYILGRRRASSVAAGRHTVRPFSDRV